MLTTNIRLLFAGVVAATAIVCARPADAAIRFHDAPDVFISGTQVCTTADISGLGDSSITIAFSVQYTASTTCRNKGGNVAPGQPLVSGTFSSTSNPIEPKNGRARINECSDPLTQQQIDQQFDPDPAVVCPNGNWSVDRIRPGDVTVSFGTVSAVQAPNTVLYSCNATANTCSEP